METVFQRVVVIGYGKVAGEVLQYVCGRQEDYGFRLEFIEHEVHPFGITEKLCRERGVAFSRITDKRELAARLDGMAERTLIVSASNNFLFPKTLVEKEHITIINFHNALLPEYPGRNAPTWVIYEGAKETGITWHYVTAGVDEGGIIVQKRCEIGADVRAYELTERLMELAGEAFRECFDGVMTQRVQARAQEFDPRRRMYRSYEVPSEGFFDLAREPEEIYRLLRSVDYGKNDLFPLMRTAVDGREAQILRYRKIAADKRKDEEGFLYLPLREGFLLKMKYR
ncbi:MAG: hypothetical protein NC311_17030, partial [Muribaculaceae bacterium]|nr:hypothetical protein [Muribaculaceae bacterium]